MLYKQYYGVTIKNKDTVYNVINCFLRLAGSQADTLKWCKIYFICYVNANKGSGMGVEKKKF